MTEQEISAGRVFNIQRYSIQDGPGIRTIVFLQGCPLQCQWCANPEGLKIPDNCTIEKLQGRWMTLDEVMVEILKDELFYSTSGGGLTLSGGEVAMQHKFAAQLLQRCQERGIHRVIETSGFAPIKQLLPLAQLCNLVLFDIKHLDDDKHHAGTGVSNKRILENLHHLIAANIPVVIRVPVIPNFNASHEEIKSIIQYANELADNSPAIQRIELLPFHQFGKNKYQKLGLTYAMDDEKAFTAQAVQEMIDGLPSKLAITIVS